MVRGHRNDIDGLRALAILPVLFYHANIWPFASGYVGVDVFFVISGYLITGLILREQDGAGFSLADFYDRRIRRILPALGVVLFASTIVALIVLLPDELREFGRNLMASALFYANIRDWQDGAQYFAPQAGENPLLHVWSLAVEEQFYLVWPPLLILLARFRKSLPAVILVAAAASLALALILHVTQNDPRAAFYLLPPRAWELLAGAFLSTGVAAPLRSAAARHGAAAAGFALILAAVLLPGADASSQLLHSFVATLGTAVLLFASEGGGNIVGDALATRLPVFVGRISYSLYLWHWPALVYARLYLHREPTFAEAAAILAAVFAASILSWRYVEQPIRRRRAVWRGRPFSFAAAGIGIGFFAVTAVVFMWFHGLPWRMPPDIRALDAVIQRPMPGRWCRPQDNCVSGNAAFVGEAVLIGDSHARVLSPVLKRFAAERHLRLRETTRPGCLPLPGIRITRPDRNFRPCAEFAEAAADLVLASHAVRLVILEARWELYVNDGSGYVAGGQAAIAAALEALIDKLNRRGVAVLVIGAVVPFPENPAHCYGRERIAGRDPSPCMNLPLAAALPRTAAADRLIAALAEHRPAVRTYLPNRALCDAAGCHALADGQLLYWDDHHLSPAGAARVGRALEAALRHWPW
ncbi:MAG: acyltransferase family protein [Rhizomicrobium sp.]